MKSILISIKPKYVAKILNGEKTIEIRKTAPKCELPIDVYIYCTKEKSYLAYERHVQEYIICDTIEKLGEHGNEVSPTDTMCALQDWGVATNGHIVAKFTLREVEETNYDHDECEEWYDTRSLNELKLYERSGLDYEQIDDYLKGNGYAWHISYLKIFDEPKELSDFGLKRAPQSWCYVEEED